MQCVVSLNGFIALLCLNKLLHTFRHLMCHLSDLKTEVICVASPIVIFLKPYQL